MAEIPFTEKELIVGLLSVVVGLLGVWLGSVQYFLSRQIAKVDRLIDEVTLIREHRITRGELHDELERIQKNNDNRFNTLEHYLTQHSERLDKIISLIANK